MKLFFAFTPPFFAKIIYFFDYNLVKKFKDDIMNY